jgi:hypothetical protein
MEHSLEAGRRQGEEGLAGRRQLHHLTVQGRIELNYTLWPSGPKIVTVSISYLLPYFLLPIRKPYSHPPHPRKLQYISTIGEHRHWPSCRRYPTSDIDISYSDIGTKYVGLNPLILISKSSDINISFHSDIGLNQYQIFQYLKLINHSQLT